MRSRNGIRARVIVRADVVVGANAHSIAGTGEGVARHHRCTADSGLMGLFVRSVEAYPRQWMGRVRLAPMSSGFGPSQRMRRNLVAGKAIKIVRVYEDTGHARGYRVLVDRLWPRGVKKAELALDEWAKDVAPSDSLRRWYGHDVERFREFARRYRAELESPPASQVVSRLRRLRTQRSLLLLTATKDVEHSGAEVLLAVLERGNR